MPVSDRVHSMSIPAAATQVSPRDQRVLIAGGSRGIGLAIADAFVRNGAQVSLCARNADDLAQAAHALRRTAHRYTPSHATCRMPRKSMPMWTLQRRH